MALTNLWKRIHGKRLAQGSEFMMELAKPGVLMLADAPFAIWQDIVVAEAANCWIGRTICSLAERLLRDRARWCTPWQTLRLAAGGGDTHLRVDGEPWQQELPDTADGGPLRVHIKLAPVPGRVLVNRASLPPKVWMQRRVCRALTAACIQQHSVACLDCSSDVIP